MGAQWISKWEVSSIIGDRLLSTNSHGRRGYDDLHASQSTFREERCSLNPTPRVYMYIYVTLAIVTAFTLGL